MKPPSPDRINAAGKVLRALAAEELAQGYTEDAELLNNAAEKCEAKAFVGALANLIPKLLPGGGMKPKRETPTCPHCGSVLSVVTWDCVRGKYCPGERRP